MEEIPKNESHTEQVQMPEDESKKPVSNKMVIALASGLSILALICIGLLLYILDVQKNTNSGIDLSAKNPQNIGEIEFDSSLEEVNQESVSGIDKMGSYTIQPQKMVREYGELFKAGELRVDWHKGAIPVSDAQMMEFLQSLDDEIDTDLEQSLFCNKDQENLSSCTFNWKDVALCEGEEGCKLSLFEAGLISNPKELQGLKLYYFFIPEMGMGLYQHPFVVFVDPQMNKLVHINTYPDETWHYDLLSHYIWFGATFDYRFTELIEPKKISIPGDASVLIAKGGYKENPNDVFGETGGRDNLGGISNVIEKNIAKPKGKVAFVFDEYGPVYFDGAKYSIVMPDGSVKVYEYLPYFLQESQSDAEEKNMYDLSYDASITWDVNTTLNSKEKYLLAGDIQAEGCGNGFSTFTNIVNNKKWFDEKKLVQIGKTSTGEVIYELNDKKTNSYYTELFEYGYEGSLMRVYTYEDIPEWTEEQKRADFDADTPLFFWKDPSGNWRSYRKAKYQTLAECGKPVIYLYPEKISDVRVEVVPNGGFTYTDPIYPHDGWFVRAKPNGELFNYANKTNYTYLFWEGHADGFGFPQQGFVFAKDEVPAGMRAVLEKTGLVGQEIEDFMEFWEEKMMKKPYVFLTFARQQDFEQSAPLRVTPRPDTTIRVFMNFELLDAPIDVEPLKIRTPERNGFTVVEWGGVLDRSVQNLE
jgi:hypothetical protein